MTPKQPLDKKIYATMFLKNVPVCLQEDVKSHLSNLKKRLKEELCLNNCIRENSDYEELIKQIFSEEIGEGLLEGENEKSK